MVMHLGLLCFFFLGLMADEGGWGAGQMGASSPGLAPIGRAPPRGRASQALARLGRVTRWRGQHEPQG
jgi:hypothetical protein